MTAKFKSPPIFPDIRYSVQSDFVLSRFNCSQRIFLVIHADWSGTPIKTEHMWNLCASLVIVVVVICWDPWCTWKHCYVLSTKINFYLELLFFCNVFLYDKGCCLVFI